MISREESEENIRRDFPTVPNIIVLDPDVAKLFPDSKTVTEVLRSIAKIAQQKVKKVAG